MKLNAKVSYLGQSEYGKEDRFATIDCDNDCADMVTDLVDEIGYDISFITDSDRGTFFYILVEDKKDYNYFMGEWKKAKKAILNK